jgi:UDP-N-acetylmuramate: L-alanyl-gamma-D-glutamyl-meso-diaminopimelate ligase
MAQVCADLQAQGVDASVINATVEIIQHIVNNAEPHDIVLILSNGGFENIHQRLLTSLQR